MRRDRPLLLLVIGAVASYPALALGWCVATLLGTEASARELWLAGHPGALAAPVLAVTGGVAVGNAIRVLVRGLWQTHRFHRWVSCRRIPGACGVPTEFDPADRVRVVDVGESLAVSVGLLRPYVVVSHGLLTAVSEPELRAVLAHERAHARRRDPLRLLLGRVLAAHLWFLPLAADIRGRAHRGYELAADRHAADCCGRTALASALLRVVSPPAMTPTAAAAGFGEPELLEARVSQLESGRPPRPVAISRRRGVLTAAAGSTFVAIVAGSWAFMLITCPCLSAVGGV